MAVHDAEDYKGYIDTVSFAVIPPATNVCESVLRFDERAMAAIEPWALESSEDPSLDRLDEMVAFFGWVEDDTGDTCSTYKPSGGSAAAAYNLQAFAKLWVVEHCLADPACDDLLVGVDPYAFVESLDAAYANSSDLYDLPHIYSELGSTLHVQSSSCDVGIIGGFRCGDYDFFTRGLIPIYFEFSGVLPLGSEKMIGENPGLKFDCDCRCISLDTCGAADPRAGCVDHASDLVYWDGSVPFDGVDVSGIWWPDTENHMVSIESARYLRNQRYNGELGGAGNTEQYLWWWFMNPSQLGDGRQSYTFHNMTDFLKLDFREYNALPYQGHTVEALNNLSGAYSRFVTHDESPSAEE